MEIKLDYENMTILTISDMHIPYHHPDAMEYLKALKKVYKPDLVVSLGDLADFHSISFHNSDPDLLSAGDELEELQSYSRELEKIFPNMIIIGSNHGDLVLRKALAHGLPKGLIRPFNEIYDVDAGWAFADDLTISHEESPDVYFVHNIRKNVLQVAQQRGQRVICGHYHENFSVSYAGNPNSLLWGCIAGCLIDKESLAFEYNKLNLNRPIIGTAIIENGYPQLAPMVLNKDGRWIGQIV